MDLKQLLLTQGPKIALAAIAARQGGPANVGALLEGIQLGEMRKQQLARQQQLDQQAIEAQSFNRSNIEADNKRLDEQQRLSKMQHAIELIRQKAQEQEQIATDPTVAENAVMQTAQSAANLYGMPADQLTGFVPNMTPRISARRQKQAMERYEALKKIYGEEAVASDAITDNGELFKGMKPSQILAMAQMGATDASGQAAAPHVKPTAANQPPATGSFEDFVLRKFGRNPTAEQVLVARKEYQQVDDPIRSRVPARDRFSVQPVTNPDGSTALVRVNLETGESTPISLPAGVAGAGKPAETERISKAYYDRTVASDVTAKSFEDQLLGLGSQLDVQLPNLLRSQQGQQYRQAKDEFINAALRRESGAAIQPSEYERFDKIYFVVPGDTAPTIKQKQEARKRVVDGFKTAAGNLGKGTTAPEKNRIYYDINGDPVK